MPPNQKILWRPSSSGLSLFAPIPWPRPMSILIYRTGGGISVGILLLYVISISIRMILLQPLQNTNKHVRLTQDKPSQSGWLWARMPLSVSNWQIDVEFKVDGKAHNIFGDGWAFWLTSDRAKQGPVFGSVDWFKGIGIFFDT